MNLHCNLVEMTLLPREYVAFLDGRLGKCRTVAYLPLSLGAHLPATVTDVMAHADYARKVKDKHHLKFEHFCLLQNMINDGWCLLSRTRRLEFLYVDNDVFQARFLLVLKAAANGREIWMATFHRTNEQQIRSHLARARKEGRLLRTHTWT